MEVKELLSADAVLELREAERRGVLWELARRASSLIGEEVDEIFAALTARETLGSTALGGGIAMPHARFSRVKKPIGVFAHLLTPVDFDAIDEREVDLVFLLLLPDQSTDGQLKPMACAARKLRDPALAARLREAKGIPALYELLTS